MWSTRNFVMHAAALFCVMQLLIASSRRVRVSVLLFSAHTRPATVGPVRIAFAVAARPSIPCRPPSVALTVLGVARLPAATCAAVRPVFSLAVPGVAVPP